MNLRLAEVLAGAYARKEGPMLVHAVDSEGNPQCRSVNADNLSDVDVESVAAPTCKPCLRAWNRALSLDQELRAARRHYGEKP
jgi:hypothetical protein